MLRQLPDTLARLFRRPRADGPLLDDRNLAREVRAPDPYVWQLPNPRDARWRRWARRNRAAGHRLPFPRDEEYWTTAVTPGAPLWEAADDVVRPYVLRP